MRPRWPRSAARSRPRPCSRRQAQARLTTGERDVGDAAGGAHRLDGEALLQALQAVPERLAAAEDDRHDHDVHVVDQAGGEELADGGRAAADADVQAARYLLGRRKRLRRAGVDEVEGGAALHLDRGPEVMGEHEDGGMERRLLAPPAPPLLIGPRSALRAELIAPHDLRADARPPVAREGVVDAGAPAFLARHGVKRTGTGEPSHQPVAGMPEGCLRALAGTGAEAIERDGHVVHTD